MITHHQLDEQHTTIENGKTRIYRTNFRNRSNSLRNLNSFKNSNKKFSKNVRIHIFKNRLVTDSRLNASLVIQIASRPRTERIFQFYSTRTYVAVIFFQHSSFRFQLARQFTLSYYLLCIYLLAQVSEITVHFHFLFVFVVLLNNSNYHLYSLKSD